MANILGPEYLADLQNQFWSEAAEAAAATVTVTKNGIDGQRHLIFGFFLNGDHENLQWSLLDGATVIHRGRLPGLGSQETIAETDAQKDLVPLLLGTSGGDVSLVVANSNIYAAGSIYGLSIPG